MVYTCHVVERSGGKWKMFYGEYEHSLDKKGRLILPAKFREVAKAGYVEKFYMTRGLDSCLFMLPEDEWKNQEAKFKSISFKKVYHPEERKFLMRVNFSNIESKSNEIIKIF